MSAAERSFVRDCVSGTLLYDDLAPAYATGRRRGGHREGICPLCAPLKFGASAQRPTLAMWSLFEGAISYNCVRCGAKGRAFERTAQRAIARDPAARRVAQERIRQSAADAVIEIERKARFVQSLWQAGEGPIGTPAETYLRARGHRGEIPDTIRFLPADDDSGRPFPELIAAAGHAIETPDGRLQIIPPAVFGLLRVILKHDGSAKADIELPKRSSGRLRGHPAWLRPINDGLALAICEGIEDAFSLAGPVGIGAWAVGGAGFFAPAAAVIPPYVESVILGEDDNEAGRKGCDKAEEVINARKDWVAGRPPSVRRVRVWEEVPA